MKGEVIGVNTEIFSPNGGNVGIAFDIPAKTVEQITASLIKSGSVTRGFLGVSIQDVTRDIADSVGLKDAKGALVTTVTGDSPGGKAGLKSGDIITKVDDAEIDDALALSRTIASKAPGTAVTLTVFRDGKETTIQATLGTLKEDKPNQPDNQTPPPDNNQVTPVTTDTGLTLVPNSGGEGVLVQDVTQDSVAADKGFSVGDTILEVDNKKVSTGKEFEDAIKAVKDSGRGTALIKAERDGNVRFIGLPLSSGN
jgi:serine protease Do